MLSPLLNTLFLAASVCLISLPLGTLLAVLMLRTDLPLRRTLLVLVATLLFVPLYLQATGWDAGLGRLGWLSLSTGTVATPVLDGWRGAIWVHAMALLPWVALIVGIGLINVEPELEEDALLDGSPRGVIARVTLPRTLPALGVAALWVLVTTASEMTVTDLYRVRTYAEVVYLDLAVGESLSQIWLAVLPGVILTAVTAGAVLSLAAVAVPKAVSRSGRPPLRFSAARFRTLAATIVFVFVLVVVGIPIANLLYKAGLVVEQVGDERLRYWSLAKFVEVVGPAPFTYATEFGWTSAISGLTALASIVLGIPLAILASRYRAASAVALTVSALGLALPGPLVALTIIWLMNRETFPLFIWLYDDTLAAPVLAMTVKTLPLTTLVCWTGLQIVSPETIDSARTEGANRLSRFWHLILPQAWPAFAVAFVLSFVIATGDLAASILVVPPGVTTIAIRVFGLLHAGVDYQVAGICLTIIVGYAIAAVSGWRLYRFFQRRRSNSIFEQQP